jgi:hypothetical protein
MAYTLGKNWRNEEKQELLFLEKKKQKDFFKFGALAR